MHHETGNIKLFNDESTPNLPESNMLVSGGEGGPLVVSPGNSPCTKSERLNFVGLEKI